jgi:glutamyl-tRNA synthetase
MSKKIRVRFAPSPTGPLHIGGIRTALFNYLFAKHNKGTFILRIEDTDQNRYVPGAESYIINSLKWCQIPFDEGPGQEGNTGPYRQSERKEIYKEYVDKLLEKGAAYIAFDTPEALDKHRDDHQARGKTFIYNWHNRLKLKNSLSLSQEEVHRRIEQGVPYVVRFKIPTDANLSFNDLIRGKITIDTNILDDKVIFKSDGMPTYHLANVVDDHLMKISHVIRGEEWLPSTPLHVLMYQAFNWPTPEFAHLPLILKPTGKGKLSKRDGDKLGFPVFPLNWQDPNTGELSTGYRETGYFPEALINFLAFLGWNPGTEQEVFTMEELISAFSLDRVHKSGARFDPDKIQWYNHHYLQTKTNKELSTLLIPIIEDKANVHIKDSSKVMRIIELLKERANFVEELWKLGSFFFIAPETYDSKAVKKAWKEGTPELLETVAEIISNTSNFDKESLQEAIKSWINSNQIGFGKVMMPLRLSLVGSLQGPDVYEIMSVIGKEQTLTRIKNAIKLL